MEMQSDVMTFTDDPSHLQQQIIEMDTKFRKACSQVLLLNSLLKSFQSRYDRAAKDNLRTYRYHLRLRLCTSEGVRNAFYEYATQMADRIETMESRLEQMGIQPVALYPEVDSDPDVSDMEM